MRRRRVLGMAFGTCAATLCGRSVIAAGRHPESFRRTTYNRCVLPIKPYADDGQVVGGVSAFSFAETASESSTRPIGLDRRERRVVQRKSFMLQTLGLQFGPFTLKNVGFLVYETGDVEVSGLISHDGGPFGRLFGGQAIIRVRAFSSGSSDRPSAKSVELWSAEATRWIAAGSETRIRFIDGNYEEVSTHFDEITHIEVNLDSRKDR